MDAKLTNLKPVFEITMCGTSIASGSVPVALGPYAVSRLKEDNNEAILRTIAHICLSDFTKAVTGEDHKGFMNNSVDLAPEILKEFLKGKI